MLIRSTAAGERLGGLARATAAAAHALAAAFDVVVIETVGVGQAETDVAEVADTVVVVVQPGAGDVLQFLKSGIMEVPDVLVVTKADLGQLAIAHAPRPGRRAALAGRRARRPCSRSPRCPRRSGIEELLDALEQHRAAATSPRAAPARPARAGAERVRRSSTASAACGRSAAAPRAQALLAEQDPGAEVPGARSRLRLRTRGRLGRADPPGLTGALPYAHARAWRPAASSRPDAR